MTYEQRKGPSRVKVNVIRDEPLPATIDRQGMWRTPEKGAAQGQTKAKTEPEWREKYLRLVADLENSKKRLAQTYQWQADQEKERLLLDFLEVADNLERALLYSEANPETLVEGLKNIQRQFQQTLAKYEVRPFNPEGQGFDPEQHEAIRLTHQPHLRPNTVAHVAQTGYTLGDKVLRPARVVVTSER